MSTTNDTRFEAGKTPRGSDSKPSSPGSSTADNASVYKQPTVEQATTDGNTEKLDKNSSEDRKHTP